MRTPNRLMTPALLAAALTAAAAQAQDKAAPPASPRAALEAYHQQDPYEKLFLHLDRSVYASGDVLWFKAYAVDGTAHRPLPLSKVAYVEVLDSRQKPVLQTKIGLDKAGGHGSLPLPATLPTGRYTLRAYTSLMKNFGADSYFQAPLAVVNTFAATQPKADTAAAAGYDVQFFPEGGQLVSGLRSWVGVKVVDKAGHGVEAEGVWLDRQGQVAARFRTLKFGMGHFELTPTDAGAPYTSVTQLPHRQTLTRQAPAVQTQGYVLHLDQSRPDQLLLTVDARTSGSGDVQLLGHARQRVFVSRSQPLTDGRTQFVLDRKDLPEGVLHFTVFDGRQQPVAERLYFRRPGAPLQVQAQLGNTRYLQRQKVSLTLGTAAPGGAALPANLSVAVFRLDQLAATAPLTDINASLWLTSDLRGTVENPDYYLRAAEPEAAEATDNLMLTQGWRRFRWDEVLAGATPLRYQPELNGAFVEARVLNGAGQPSVGTTAFLTAPGRYIRLYNGVSRQDGLVRFEVKDLRGPRQLVLQPDGRQDSTSRIELLSPFATDYGPATPGRPLVFSDAYRTELTQRHVEVQSQAAYFMRRQLPTPQPLTDSATFYGRATETYRLDDFTRFPTIEDVLREYVPGVQVRQRKPEYALLVADRPRQRLFDENPLVLVDGVPVFSINRVLKLDPLKVQRLDVMTNLYVQGPLSYSGLLSFRTYRGDLGGVRLAPGALLAEYEGPQWEREFYSPRYDTPEQQQSRLLDLRNLLYWNPAVTTSTGAQKLEFFTPDQPGQYQVVVQGLAGNGLAGSSSLTFEVQSQGLASGR